jgi:hypothetical protein
MRVLLHFQVGNNLVDVFLIPHMREPFMPELVPGSAFTLRAGSIRLSQGIGRVINLDLAMLRYRHIKMLVNVSGESNTL